MRIEFVKKENEVLKGAGSGFLSVLALLCKQSYSRTAPTKTSNQHLAKSIT
jgi:hypothetical protein